MYVLKLFTLVCTCIPLFLWAMRSHLRCELLFYYKERWCWFHFSWWGILYFFTTKKGGVGNISHDEEFFFLTWWSVPPWTLCETPFLLSKKRWCWLYTWWEKESSHTNEPSHPSVLKTYPIHVLWLIRIKLDTIDEIRVTSLMSNHLTQTTSDMQTM